MSKTVKTLLGDFDFDTAQKFRQLHQHAVSEKNTHFRFHGKHVDTNFAAYMVEFLCEHFPLESEDKDD